MNLIEPEQLDRLVDTHPLLDRKRRSLLVDHIKSVETAPARKRLFDIFERSMEAEEFAFVRACFGCGEPVRSGTPGTLLLPAPNEEETASE